MANENSGRQAKIAAGTRNFPHPELNDSGRAAICNLVILLKSHASQVENHKRKSNSFSIEMWAIKLPSVYQYISQHYSRHTFIYHLYGA